MRLNPPRLLRLSGLLALCWLPLTSPANTAPAGEAVTTRIPAPAADTHVAFPRYKALQPKVDFWTAVFATYSENQSVVHSALYPHKVLKVLDFRDEKARLDERSYATLRAREEKRAKEDLEHLLHAIDTKRNDPASMSTEEARVYRLFADVSGPNRFRRMQGTVRIQRGLAERTRHALEVSARYLPYMEGVFRSYKLPTELTRLPLVESSFNLDAYSKAGAAGVWQFIPSTARIYMRMNEVVDERRDPWTSTDAAARHLRDDYAMLGDWPLAITAYNQGRNGIKRSLEKIRGNDLIDLIERNPAKRFGFAGKNYYAEFLAAVDIERQWRAKQAATIDPIEFEVVETRHYVPYETLRKLCDADDEVFRRLNPAYRPEVIAGKLYVPPGHLIRVPAGAARDFEVAYARLGAHERFDQQRVYFLLHKVSKGETLGVLARRFGTQSKAIRQANGLKSDMIRIGQVLKIPPREESRPGPIAVAVGEPQPSLTRSQRAAAMEEEKSAARRHTVRSGDTLDRIARQYRVSVAALRTQNALQGSLIKVGQQLSIPPGTAAGSQGQTATYRSHTVRSGQTLSAIAKRYGVSVQALRDANSMSGSMIKPGQKLRVPQST